MNPGQIESVLVFSLRVKIHVLLRRDKQRPLHIHARIGDILFTKLPLKVAAKSADPAHRKLEQRPAGCVLDLIRSLKIWVWFIPIKTGEKTLVSAGALIVEILPMAQLGEESGDGDAE